MPSDEYRSPALVLGGPWHTTLSVIHALARAGIPQFTVCARSSYVAYSRWHRRLPRTVGPEPSADTLGSFLERMPFERMVLIPCADDWVAAVAGLGPDLAARFPASVASPEAIDICLDKGRFAATLASLGLPHPRTTCLGEFDDAWALAQTFRDPIIKPRDSLAFRARYGVKAFRVTTAADLATRMREAREAGLELMLQEFIPGPATSHYLLDGFIDRSGSVAAWFARRRVRTHPEPFGESSCMVSMRREDAREPTAILEPLLQALEYRGVLSAEFKYDERDGVFKLIEINPRAWGGLSLPVSCGVNLIEMAYRDALGLRVEPALDHPIDRAWVHGTRDAVACWPLLRAGQVTVREWVRTWMGAVDPIIRLDDPAPGAVHLLQVLRGALRAAVVARPVSVSGPR